VVFVPIWIAIHFIYEWGSRDSLYFRRFAISDTLSPANLDGNRASVFLDRVPKHLRDSILALEADQHYIIIYSANGEGRILYRFGDAVSELETYEIGLRVHRSWWVANNAVAAIEGERKALKLRLSNGMLVPVSHANSAAARRNWEERGSAPLADTLISRI
ncbi:MAG: LytTR family DNA-binding domain-containing protein, partial [Pseudomonadota bacterium]